MHHSARLVALALAVLLLPRPAVADGTGRLSRSLAPVQIGDRLRIRFHTGDPTVGVLAACTADTCTIQPCGACRTFPVPLASIKSWDVSAGTHRQWFGGAIIGGLVGATIGLAASAATVVAVSFGTTSADERPIAVCSVAGATLGMLIGLGIEHESWERAAVAPPPPRPAPLPGEHVRVQLDKGLPLQTARLVEEDSLVYVHGGDLTGFPIDSLERLQKPHGKVGQSKKGAIIGGVLGALVGASVASKQENTDSVEGDRVAMAFWYGGAGAAAGAVLGMSVRTDRWVDEPLASRAHVPACDPQPPGMGLSPLIPRSPAGDVRVTLATVHF